MSPRDGGVMRAIAARTRRGGAWAMLLAIALPNVPPAAAGVPTPVPMQQRGDSDNEHFGQHDASNVRTIFWNYGMVGDYPPDPGNVDLSVFHSAEAPKGTGMNYSDGITPFVLARVQQRNGDDAYIMETGFRERQGVSPYFNRVMRFEPRPGYFQNDLSRNIGRSPAMSHDPRTWPDEWPDKLDDPLDRGWAGSWNGYFGKRPAADQESFTVMDDQYYDGWDYFPDSRDTTRRGLGLRVEVRGFQWANPQAGNVIFWHYDITNESTTDYNDNIIFGLYMDSGVGGSALSCDGIFESDDDNAYFDRSTGLNLVYTWDRFGHGRDRSGNCGRTGYLGYAYLETPGKPEDGVDNDGDGMRDEKRDGGPGTKYEGADVLTQMAARYDTSAFSAFYGPISSRPAVRAGVWWTGDEDMDWVADLNDVGADGVADTHDLGEGDGVPTEGEPNFDRTDLNESDQIGLTGFKMNRIRAGVGNPDPTVDNVLFFSDAANWPQRLYQKFTDFNPAARFDSALAANYNLGFLFASGPFTLGAGKTERFSLALAYGADLYELRSTVTTVQQIYNANYQFAVPPAMPTVTAETGDHRVTLSWDDVAERSVDPVTSEFDFEGYRIYRSTDPDFRDVKLVSTGRGTPLPGNGKANVQFDLVDGKRGYTRKTVEGVSYYLGDETGLQHTWTDTDVTNGQEYYYAVCAYDFGFDSPLDSLAFYPSENSIAVSRTLRGGLILPKNVVRVRPERKVAGWQPAEAETPTHVAGQGRGSIAVGVTNSALVQDGHVYRITFTSPSSDSIRATTYALSDSTAGTTLFASGHDLDGVGNGPVGGGMLPVIRTQLVTQVDSARTGYRPGGPTNTLLKTSYQPVLTANLRRPGYPDDLTVEFDDVVRDTGLAVFPQPARPAKFRVISHGAGGDQTLDFRFRDLDANGTLSRADEYIDVCTYAANAPTIPQVTWRVQLDTLGQGARGPIAPPRLGDVYDVGFTKPFGAADVYRFVGRGARVDGAAARAEWKQKPYVVPNPYVGAASFESAPYAESGRGERRIEFRAMPSGSVIHIYTVRGDLVQTLRHDGSADGFVPWDLRTKDNLDVAPGLYVFQVEAPGLGEYVGKFAVIK